MKRRLVLRLAVILAVLGIGVSSFIATRLHAQVVGPVLTAGTYVIFPGGVKVQFGITPSGTAFGSGVTQIVTYPQACTAAVLDAHMTPVAAINGSGSYFVSPVSLASMTLQNNNAISSSFFWQVWCI